MKNIFERLSLFIWVFLILGSIIVSATWTDMGAVNTGDQLTATLWNNLVWNVNELNSRWSTGATSSVNYMAGNVGINTVSPSEKLEVNGNIKATAFLYSSDLRLKENIAILSGSLEKVLSLHGYSYTWKDSKKNDLGIIAQEVESQYPDIVHTDMVSGMKSVEYGNLIGPMIEAIRELKQFIDITQTSLLSIQTSISTLTERIEDMKKSLDLLFVNFLSHERELQLQKEEIEQLRIQNTEILKRLSELEKQIK